MLNGRIAQQQRRKIRDERHKRGRAVLTSIRWKIRREDTGIHCARDTTVSFNRVMLSLVDTGILIGRYRLSRNIPGLVNRGGKLYMTT